MCRTIVGISANLCPVDEAGKNIHTSVSRKFVDGVRMAGGLPMVIPVGDKSLVRDYVETIDKLILSGGQNVHPKFYGEEKTLRFFCGTHLRMSPQKMGLQRVLVQPHQLVLFRLVRPPLRLLNQQKQNLGL